MNEPPAGLSLQTSRTVAPPQTRSRTIVAWVSAVVLAVLAYVCVVTILSVVRPVRRLLEATTRLARGQIAPHLAPGGIRELNTLSQAFNDMAERLAAAEAENIAALQSLETRIDERTCQLQVLAERDPLTRACEPPAIVHGAQRVDRTRGRATAASWARSFSTSTTSRRSTTAWATRMATAY